MQTKEHTPASMFFSIFAKYDMISTVEKQAARSAPFVFPVLINEQTVCVADNERDSAGLRV